MVLPYSSPGNLTRGSLRTKCYGLAVGKRKKHVRSSDLPEILGVVIMFCIVTMSILWMIKVFLWARAWSGLIEGPAV